MTWRTYTDQGDGCYTCDECQAEMSVDTSYPDAVYISCQNEKCQNCGKKHCVWMSESAKADIRADEKIHEC